MQQKLHITIAVDLEVPPNIPTSEVAEGALQQVMSALSAWSGWRARKIIVQPPGGNAVSYIHQATDSVPEEKPALELI